jgi:prepilin-type processing-associated H-X9-DG protein
MRKAVNAVVIALIGVMGAGLLVPLVVKLRESADREKCRDNLRLNGNALANHRDHLGFLPFAAEHNPYTPLSGKQLPPEKRLSWHVRMGIYISSDPFWGELAWDQPWDAEENRIFSLLPIKYLSCPALPREIAGTTLLPTPYVGIAGLGDDAAYLPMADPRAGFFGYERKIDYPDLKAGPSQTLVALETAAVSGSWVAAGPATVRGLDPTGPPYLGANGQFGGTHRDGANALFADGSVRLLNVSVDPRHLEALATLAAQPRKNDGGEH